MKIITKLLIVGLFSVLIQARVSATSLITISEAPNAVNSTLGGTTVFDFNNLSLGKDTNVSWSGVGTFDQLYIKSADTYGGAADANNTNGTRYSVQGVGTSVSTTTLTLNTPSSYFGFWWSAGDVKNKLSFYNGNTLVQEFTTSSLMYALPSSYYGNPKNRSLDSGEPFAFVNFYGETGTVWDKIVFNNNGSSGFEADNFTSRVAAWVPNTDGYIGGIAVAKVQGGTTIRTNNAELVGTQWAQGPASAPGAPAPPLPLLIAFGMIALVKCKKSKED